jgi:uncharacterized phage-associated protein
MERAMAHILNVARHISNRTPGLTAMKLQKLVYYSQAWSLVWDEAPLFEDRIEAWANGPVVSALYFHHRGQFQVNEGMFAYQPDMPLTEIQVDTVNRVIDFYAPQTAQWLSDLTHMEDPWVNAREREGLADGQRGDPEITMADMAEYYSGLMPNVEAQ